MEQTTPQTIKTGPKDFFLWVGAIVTLYGSVSLFITLLFEYIDSAFPDPLAYAGDPYAGAVRFAVSGLVVLVPAFILIMRSIRSSIEREPARAHLWVRRWAVMLTIFLALLTVVIDLITLINTFLGGEISERFLLKAGVVLLVALLVSLHFFADFKGYWLTHKKKANVVGIAVGVLVLIAIVSGFFIIGTPSDLRKLREDENKVNDLRNIQYQIVYFWQLKQTLPESLTELNDPLSGFTLPKDVQTGEAYKYERTSSSSFKLCATFNAPTRDTGGQGAYQTLPVGPYEGNVDENWKHEAGETCFARTIDPERYPPFTKGM